MAQAKTRWFVEPTGDTTTNAAIAELVTREGITEAEHSIVVEGRVRLVYEVPYGIIAMLERSFEHRNKFRVYTSAGRYGAPRQWLFKGWPKKKPEVQKGVKGIRA